VFNSPEQPYISPLESADGGVMEPIDRTLFDRELKHALDIRRLAEGSLYSAYGFSLPMAMAQRALAFHIRVLAVESPLSRHFLQHGGVHFALLDADYQPASTHTAEFHSDGTWGILSEKSTPIIVKGSGEAHGLQKIRSGFITEHSDTTFEDIINRE
jgi:hypothetical protein